MKLIIELDPDAEGIAGRVTAPDGTAIDFAGWLGLAAAIERLRQRRA